MKPRATVLPNKANRSKIARGPLLTPNTKQIIIPSNINNMPKHVADTISKLLANGDVGQTSNILASLAAIADAANKGNNNNVKSDTEEAVQWLEQQALNNSSNDNDSMFQSAIDGGQTVNLTEAGKLALNSFIQSERPSNSNADVNSQKKIIVISDSSHLPKLINNSHLLVSGSSNLTESPTAAKVLKAGGKVVKLTKPVTLANLPKNIQVIRPPASGNNLVKPVSSETESLRKQLEACKKQVEEYKQKLEEKDKMIASLKQQVESLTNGKATT